MGLRHLANRHGQTIGEQGGEICNTGSGDVTARAPCGPEVSGEVE